MLSKGSYNRVQEKVFLFDRETDCVFWDGFLFINSVTNFRKIFDYFEQLRLNASSCADAIINRIPIDNAEEFKSHVVGQFQMMSKLATISRRPYISSVTIDDLKRTIDHFKLPLTTTGTGANEKLVFDPHPQRRWLILKLLDDDFLGSVMTTEKYSVSSKSRNL